MTNSWRMQGQPTHPSICPDKLAALLAKPDSQILSNSKRATVYRIFHGEQSYIIKCFHLFSFWAFCKSLFRPSRARRYFDNAQQLSLYGIHTPTVYFAAGSRRFGILSQAFICTEYLDGEDAVDYFHHADLGNTVTQKYADQIIEILRRFVRLGINHGDLGIWNFKLCQDKVYVLDLDAMRRGESHDLALFMDRLSHYSKSWLTFFKLAMHR